MISEIKDSMSLTSMSTTERMKIEEACSGVLWTDNLVKIGK